MNDPHASDRRFEFIDVTLRDAHQCLWSTRMTTAMMTPIVGAIDRAGYAFINILGGAVFDVCVRYLHENPWERIGLLCERFATPCDGLTRGQSLYTFELFPDDIVALNSHALARRGIEVLTVYDALNDNRNILSSVRRRNARQRDGDVHAIAGAHRRLLRRAGARARRAVRRFHLRQGSDGTSHTGARAHAVPGARRRCDRHSGAAAFSLPVGPRAGGLRNRDGKRLSPRLYRKRAAGQWRIAAGNRGRARASAQARLCNRDERRRAPRSRRLFSLAVRARGQATRRSTIIRFPAE